MQDQLDYQGIRHRFSLAGEVSRWVPLTKVGTHYVGICPFHRERQPSFTVYETEGRFYCYGCGVWGDIIDFVKRMRPDLTTGREVIAYLTEQGNGCCLGSPCRSDRFVALTEGHNVPYASKYRPICETSMKEVCTQVHFFYDSLCAAEARRYASERGWFRKPGELVDVEPYPIGEAYIRTRALHNSSLVGFPKFVLTRRTASLFSLEREFGRQASKLCVGVKVRLTPLAYEL